MSLGFSVLALKPSTLKTGLDLHMRLRLCSICPWGSTHTPPEDAVRVCLKNSRNGDHGDTWDNWEVPMINKHYARYH